VHLTSAIVATLPPGNYTAIVHGVNGTSGAPPTGRRLQRNWTGGRSDGNQVIARVAVRPATGRSLQFPSLDSTGLLDYQCGEARAHMGPAKIYFIIFGILTIAGGIVGYVKAGSLPSIIAGSITGVLLLIAGSLLPEHRAAGLATGLVISLLLAAQFIPKFLRTGKAMPAGMMSILSVIGIIMAIVAWVKK